MRVADVTSVDMMCSVQHSDWPPKWTSRAGWSVMSRWSDRLSGTWVIGFEARGTILLAMRLAV